MRGGAHADRCPHSFRGRPGDEMARRMQIEGARAGGLAQGRCRRAQGGFTLVEIMISAIVLVLGMLGFVRVIASSVGSSSSNQESNQAIQAARAKIEEIQTADFADLFRLYNIPGGDDPGGAGTAPGATFTVPGLQPDPADPDGIVGQILLPAMVGAGGAWEVREDFQSAALGTPRDLSGDGVWDQLDHSLDYGVMPVQISLRWRGVRGVSRMDFKILVAPL